MYIRGPISVDAYNPVPAGNQRGREQGTNLREDTAIVSQPLDAVRTNRPIHVCNTQPFLRHPSAVCPLVQVIQIARLLIACHDSSEEQYPCIITSYCIAAIQRLSTI